MVEPEISGNLVIVRRENEMYEEIVEEIIEGRRLQKGEDVSFLLTGNLEELKRGANRIREALCGNKVDLCTIINGRAGKCSENCKFCGGSSKVTE